MQVCYYRPVKTAHQKTRRSDCPVNFAVEMLGDKWSLILLRDIIFWGMRTYGELLRSDEKIATNILAGRLEYLENEGLISKTEHPTDKRKDNYNVTEKGLDLVPMFIEMIAWSAGDEEWQSLDHSGAVLEQIRLVERALNMKGKFRLVADIKESVRRGECYFEGVTRPKQPA